MKQEEIYDKIRKWSQEAGECFNDCFTHDTVDNTQWAEFLVKEGLIQRGHAILQSISEGEDYFDQEYLYEIKPYYDEETGERLDEEMENYHYNMSLVAKFISENDDYIELFNEFIKNR